MVVDSCETWKLSLFLTLGTWFGRFPCVRIIVLCQEKRIENLKNMKMISQMGFKACSKVLKKKGRPFTLKLEISGIV